MFSRKTPDNGKAISTVAAARSSGTMHRVSDEEAKGPFIDAINSEGVVIIGKGTRIVGKITDCAKLEIQGTVEGSIVAETLVIRDTGIVKGDLQAVQAEIHGQFEGQLDVRDALDVRSTGRVQGELSYGRLAVAMGGHIAGQVSSETPDPRLSSIEVQPEVVPQVPSERPALNGYANGHANGTTNGF